MENFNITFTDPYWENFRPLSFTKPVACLRVGILSFQERWVKLLSPNSISYLTQPYLKNKFPFTPSNNTLFINPSFLPTPTILSEIKRLKHGQALSYKGEILASNSREITQQIEIYEDVVLFKKHTDLFSLNHHAIEFDFNILTADRLSQPLSPTNTLIGDPANLFIEEGASVECSTLNVSKGKIYIAKDAEVMEGCHLRGPIAICQHAVVNMAAKIYGATTIGNYSKVGGELNNVVITAYSNKGHDGFLGNSVLGEWCNLGADTNSSNLKNNYSEVQLWDYNTSTYQNSGLMFCGLIMGDHSKSAINTQFNTGTIVGVGANIFCDGFPPKHIAHFNWGGHSCHKFIFEEFTKVAARVMDRRNVTLSEQDIQILHYLYNLK